MRFLFGQIAKQLPRPGISRLLCSLLVVLLGLQFHQADLFLHGGQSQRTHQPDRFPLDKAFDILTPN